VELVLEKRGANEHIKPFTVIATIWRHEVTTS